MSSLYLDGYESCSVVQSCPVLSLCLDGYESCSVVQSCPVLSRSLDGYESCSVVQSCPVLSRCLDVSCAVRLFPSSFVGFSPLPSSGKRRRQIGRWRASRQ